MVWAWLLDLGTDDVARIGNTQRHVAWVDLLMLGGFVDVWRLACYYYYIIALNYQNMNAM